MMTLPWSQIVAHCKEYEGPPLDPSVREIGSTDQRGPIGWRTFAWTSMFDLCIVQCEVSYPYNGPFLRLSPVSEHQVELRYIDTPDKTRQWNRTIEAEQTFPHLIKFLDFF